MGSGGDHAGRTAGMTVPMQQRLLHIALEGERHVVLARMTPSGAVVSCGVPATNWHTWSPGQRRVVDLVAEVNAHLGRGLSLRALARRYEDLLCLVEALEQAEDAPMHAGGAA